MFGVCTSRIDPRSRLKSNGCSESAQVAWMLGIGSSRMDGGSCKIINPIYSRPYIHCILRQLVWKTRTTSFIDLVGPSPLHDVSSSARDLRDAFVFLSHVSWPIHSLETGLVWFAVKLLKSTSECFINRAGSKLTFLHITMTNWDCLVLKTKHVHSASFSGSFGHVWHETRVSVTNFRIPEQIWLVVNNECKILIFNNNRPNFFLIFGFKGWDKKIILTFNLYFRIILFSKYSLF